MSKRFPRCSTSKSGQKNVPIWLNIALTVISLLFIFGDVRGQKVIDWRDSLYKKQFVFKNDVIKDVLSNRYSYASGGFLGATYVYNNPITHIKANVNFSGSKFEKHVSIYNTKFDKELKFTGVRITKGIELQDCTVKAGVFFDSCHIKDYLSADKVNTMGSLSMNDAEIEKLSLHRFSAASAMFNGSEFGTFSITVAQFGALFCSHITIKGETYLSYAASDRANFSNSTIVGNMEFVYCQFKKISFEEATIQKSVSFSVCALPYVSFSRTKFTGIANLRFDKMPDTLDLTEFTSENDINISCRYPNTARAAYIRLDGGDIHKLNIQCNFKLLLRDERGAAFSYEKSLTVYQSLLKNLSDRGQLVTYQKMDIEYQKFKDASWFKIRSRIESWWWNFGYDYSQLFLNIFLLLTVFTGVTYLQLNYLQKNVYAMEAFKFRRGFNFITTHHSFKRLWYSLCYSVVVFLLLALKIDHLKLSHKPAAIIGTIYLLSMHIIGLFCIGFIVKFVFHM